MDRRTYHLKDAYNLYNFNASIGNDEWCLNFWKLWFIIRSFWENFKIDKQTVWNKHLEQFGRSSTHYCSNYKEAQTGRLRSFRLLSLIIRPPYTNSFAFIANNSERGIRGMFPAVCVTTVACTQEECFKSVDETVRLLPFANDFKFSALKVKLLPGYLWTTFLFDRDDSWNMSLEPVVVSN